MNIVPNKPIRTIFNIIKSFFNDDITYYAASLSFFTIFSFLPILALLIVFISYFNILDPYTTTITNFIINNLNPTNSTQFTQIIEKFLSNTHSLGKLGVFYMLFIFIMFFKDYEYIISKIHKTDKRAIYLSFIIYLIVLLILPMLFTIFILIIKLFDIYLFSIFLSYLASWIFFIIVFKISVNKPTNTKALFLSSFITMISLNITKSIFIQYIAYNKTYATIYGSFSSVLFFFLWIYLSWLIYLYGIKIFYLLNKNYTTNTTVKYNAKMYL
jgi:membrane protein